jgi:hypothetical protein
MDAKPELTESRRGRRLRRQDLTHIAPKRSDVLPHKVSSQGPRSSAKPCAPDTTLLTCFISSNAGVLDAALAHVSRRTSAFSTIV